MASSERAPFLAASECWRVRGLGSEAFSFLLCRPQFYLGFEALCVRMPPDFVLQMELWPELQVTQLQSTLQGFPGCRRSISDIRMLQSRRGIAPVPLHFLSSVNGNTVLWLLMPQISSSFSLPPHIYPPPGVGSAFLEPSRITSTATVLVQSTVPFCLDDCGIFLTGLLPLRLSPPPTPDPPPPSSFLHECHGCWLT